MIPELLIGSAMIIATVLVACVFIAVAVSLLTRAAPWLVARGPFLPTDRPEHAYALVARRGHGLPWAGLFLVLGEFASLREALYFATVSATTVREHPFQSEDPDVIAAIIEHIRIRAAAEPA